MGIALPGADAAARRVDENAVEASLRRQLRGAIPDGGAKIEDRRACRASFEDLEPPHVAIGGPDHPFVRHQIGEMQQLAALAGAGIPPRLARMWRARVAHKL